MSHVQSGVYAHIYIYTYIYIYIYIYMYIYMLFARLSTIGGLYHVYRVRAHMLVLGVPDLAAWCGVDGYAFEMMYMHSVAPSTSYE